MNAHFSSHAASGGLARLRPVLMILAVLSLLAGLWAGLLRLGWALPELPLASNFVAKHGALMLASFLGTLIALERAAALNRRWAYFSPALSGLGGAAMLVGLPDGLSIGLLVLGSLGLLLIFAYILKQHFSLPYGLMAIGAGLCFTGNLLWWLGRPIYQAAPWWVAFLVLTVLGERLELGRVLVQRRARMYLVLAAASLIGLGLLVSLLQFELGVRLCGLGFLAVGAWLLRYDIARHTIRLRGLPRYMAACLLPGYVWLSLSGLLWLILAPLFVAGPGYDAMLHTILVGFVFSMIFGHAPVIVPVVTGAIITAVKRLYLPLLLLHAALLLRIAGDLLGLFTLRQWGGLLNEVAILLFAALLIRSAMSTAPAGNNAAPRTASAA